jgi:hypothetical protein
MMKSRLLVFVFLAVLGVLGANSHAQAPFSLAVVPSWSYGDRVIIEMSGNRPRDFYVVLTNVSGVSQNVWETSNSWGYRTISFELTTDDGKKVIVSRGPEVFTKNNPSTFAIQPNEHQAYAIHLDKWWVTNSPLRKSDEMPISVKAIYEVPATQEARERKVWIGRIESHTYNFTLRQW